MTATATPIQTDRDTFLTALRAADLLNGKQYDRAISELTPCVRTALEVAEHFRNSELLTRFQIDRLLTGRTDGFHIGPYLVLDYLGKNTGSRVYKARHKTMNRLVAINILAPHRTATEEVRASIRAEARAAARLAHTNIVTLLDANQAGERMYFVKEYLDGGSLEALVREQGPLPVHRACEFIRQAALGLQHAHDLGTSHGWLSPAAIIVGRAGSKGSEDKPLVKVSGFGLDRIEADPEKLACEYRAPEQLADPNSTSPLADLYSLGGVLHWLLAGLSPMLAPTLRDLRPDVPTPLAKFVQRLLSSDPQARPASARDVARFLTTYADGIDTGAIEFVSMPPTSTGTPSSTEFTLSGFMADRPHEQDLHDDDLSPSPTMVIEAASLATPFATQVAASETLSERGKAFDSTLLGTSNRKPKRLPKRSARKKRSPVRRVNRRAFAALLLGMALGLFLLLLYVLKLYAATKG